MRYAYKARDCGTQFICLERLVSVVTYYLSSGTLNSAQSLTHSQWRRQLWGTGARAPSTSNDFIFSSLWTKSESQLSKYCVVCEISSCTADAQSTTHSSSFYQ